MPENEQNKDQAQRNRTGDTSRSAGDPGPTPGKAEGDEETVDEDIEQKLGDRKTQRG